MSLNITPGIWEYATGDNYSSEAMLPNGGIISLSRIDRYGNGFDCIMSREEMENTMRAVRNVPEMYAIIERLAEVGVNARNESEFMDEVNDLSREADQLLDRITKNQCDAN